MKCKSFLDVVNLFRLYSQPFSGYLVNFFSMDEFNYPLKRPFFS